MSSLWVIRDEEGMDWEITPIIRFIKKKGKLILQQKYVQIKRIMVKGGQNERPFRWIDVPLIDEDYRAIEEEPLH